MSLWWVSGIGIAAALMILSWARMKIPRDLSHEKPDDAESTLAYDRVSRWFFFNIIRFYVMQQLKKFQPRGTLLDAGCGPGYLISSIRREFPRLSIIGVDLSPGMLKLATANQAVFGSSPQVTFREANIQRLPLDSNSIEFVVSTLSMHHWIEPDLCLLEIYRVLRPGGQFLIFDLRRDMPRSLFYTVWLFQNLLAPFPIRRVNGGIGSIWSSFTPPEMVKLLAASPFENWRVQSNWGWAYLLGKK